MPDDGYGRFDLVDALWTRTTLEFKPECHEGIQSAIDVLEQMQESKGRLEYKYSEPAWVVALAFALIQLVYMIFNTACIFSTSCRESKSNYCFRINSIFHSLLFLVLSGAALSLSALNYQRLKPRYETLRAWVTFSDCVDSYMQINDY